MTNARHPGWDWLQQPRLDPLLRMELVKLAHENQMDELRDRFSQELSFGTGGLRAKIGVGTNRINVHTVAKAAYGVARFAKTQSASTQAAVAIAYDGRRMSREFAETTAAVFAAQGVRAFLFSQPEPTPILSFAVRHLGCDAGIVITASHNPPEYNGFKVYGADGGQLLPEDADLVIAHMSGLEDLFAISILNIEDAKRGGLVVTVSEETIDGYFRELQPLRAVVEEEAKSDLRIVYTPLHGVGGDAVMRALQDAGFADVHVVSEQFPIDAEFTFAATPNPEEPAAFERALAVARDVDADLVLATDPDTDRVGVAAKKGTSAYELLSGNDIGALLLDDILRFKHQRNELPQRGVVVTTIVTSDFGEAVAKRYGVTAERTLTGFKYIGAKIGEYEAAGDRAFLFGYEESVGYLALPFVRDKDAVQAAVLIANMAARQKQMGRTLIEAREQLFAELGRFRDRLLGFTFSGPDGSLKMAALMSSLREDPLQADGLSLVSADDYLTGRRTVWGVDAVPEFEALPAADVLKFRFAGGHWAAVRPSGTEPKLKVYLGARADSETAAEGALKALNAAVTARIAEK